MAPGRLYSVSVVATGILQRHLMGNVQQLQQQQRLELLIGAWLLLRLAVLCL
jgi:hypothetical protein